MSYQPVPTSEDEPHTQLSSKSPSAPQSKLRTRTLIVFTALALLALGYLLRKWSSTITTNSDKSVTGPADHSVGDLVETPQTEMSSQGKLNVA